MHRPIVLKIKKCPAWQEIYHLSQDFDCGIWKFASDADSQDFMEYIL